MNIVTLFGKSIVTLFGKSIYANKLEIDAGEIVSMIDTPRKSYSIETVPGEKKDLYVLENPKFKFLKDIILKELHSYTHNQMRYVNDFQITTSWFTKVDKNESSQFHNHNNCFISGVLYLQTSKDCGNILFENFSDVRSQLLVKEHNILNSNQFAYEPEDGLILFFPSEVWHKVEENKSERTRYSLSFNVIPKGVVGCETGDSHVII
jgi:uncharacterized protein (TIGR02466 family)